MIEDATKIMLGIILAVVVVIVMVFYHGLFIRECVASGNTETYCEIKFWNSL